jgi:hypothetical protein
MDATRPVLLLHTWIVIWTRREYKTTCPKAEYYRNTTIMNNYVAWSKTKNAGKKVQLSAVYWPIYIPLTTGKGTATSFWAKEGSSTSQGAKYYEKPREEVKLQAMERKTAGISGQRVRAGHCQHKHVFSVHNPTARGRFQCCCSSKTARHERTTFSRTSNITLNKNNNFS